MGFGKNPLPPRPDYMRMEVRGLDDIQRALMDLKPALARRIVRGAMAKAARVVVSAAKRHAETSKETGTLQRSIGFKVLTGKGGIDAGTVMAIVGPRRRMGRQVAVRKKKRGEAKLRAFSIGALAKAHRAGRIETASIEYRDPTRYAHLVEKGTVHSAADPFLRRAIDGSRDMCLAILRADIGSGITREAQKVAGRGKSR